MARVKKEKPDLDPNLFTKSGKPRKRKPKQNREYFPKATEDAIIRYNLEIDPEEKKIIYEKYIYYSFYKLVENIIHTYKYYNSEGDSVNDKKHEALVMLMDKLQGYNPELGKAYSYFGTIARRYFIQEGKKAYENMKKRGDLAEVDEDHIVKANMNLAETEADAVIVMNDFISYVKVKMVYIFPRDKDREIAQHLVELFDNREFIHIWNKQTFYLHIREMTGAETPHITRVVKVLKSIYKDVVNKHYTDGEI